MHLSIGLAVLISATSPAEAAEAIFGRWLTDDRSGIVRIDRCGEKLCGRIVRVLHPDAADTDVNNPDRSLRSRPVIGLEVLSGFVRKGSQWEDGRAYDPKTGKSYKSRLKLLGDGTLKVTGCVLFICDSRNWTRAR